MMTIDELNHLNSDELQAVIQKDTDGDAEILFALEGELMGIMHDAVFPGSETFGDLDEETKPERYVRALVESMGFAETLSAINALNDLAEEEDDDDEDDD